MISQFTDIPILLNSMFLALFSKRTFYPGKSFFFWVLIGLLFYLYYLYTKSKNKKVFFKSDFIRSVTASVILFLCSFFIINLFFNDPVSESVKEEEEDKTPIEVLLAKDRELMEKSEKDFTNPYIHHEYITHHFNIPSSFLNKHGYYEERDDYTILNYYNDKYSVSDSLYIDNARLALGMIYYKRDELEKSYAYFDSIWSNNLALKNNYKALIFLHQGDTANAIVNYKLAAKIKDEFQDNAKLQVIYLLNATHQDAALYSLLKDKNYTSYFNEDMVCKYYFLNNDLLDYYSTKIVQYFGHFKWTGLIAATVILFIWIFYITRMDLFEKESAFFIWITLAGGMFFVLGCFYLYDLLEFSLHFYQRSDNLLLYSIFGIGMVEETVKIIPLLLLLLFTKNVVNEPYDYILYASLSALGFAFLENIIYFHGDLSSVIHGRALMSVPGHIIDSSIVAYGLVLAKYRYKSFPSIIAFVLSFLAGCVNHGLYDYWLFSGNLILFIFTFLLSVTIWIIIINNCLNNSPSFNYLIDSRPKYLQLFISLSFLGILLIEYILVAFEKGPVYANASFNNQLLVAGIMIIYFANRLTNFDLVKGYWATIPLKTVRQKKSGEGFDIKNFLYRLISGNTFDHSFVQTKVLLMVHPTNSKLMSHFNYAIQAVISDRLVVSCLSSVKEEYEDPYWFKLTINHAINIDGNMTKEFLFRFEEEKPSFSEREQLVVYLFTYREYNPYKEKTKREDLRALGRCVIQKA